MIKYVERVVKVTGDGCANWGVLPKSARYLSHFTEDGVRRSARMRIQAKSRSIGRRIKSHTDLWTIYEKGWSTEGWVFLAPTLKEAAPELLEQKSLFGEDFNESDTAFEFLQDAVNVVRSGSEDSERFDADLLLDLSMKSAAANGVSEIKLLGVDRVEAQPADLQLRMNAGALLEKTPPPKRMRLVGVLDMVRSSNFGFELVLEDGQRLKGVWTGEEVSVLGEFWSKRVTLDADIIYKPSGKPLRLEGLAVRSPQARDAAFSPGRIERGVKGQLNVPKGVLTVDELIGSWPGSETDEEIAEALALLRG